MQSFCAIASSAPPSVPIARVVGASLHSRKNPRTCAENVSVHEYRRRGYRKVDFMEKIFKARAWRYIGVAVLSFIVASSGIIIRPNAAIGFPFREDTFRASYTLAEAIELILTQYAGEPVALEELVTAALLGMTDLLDENSHYYTADEWNSFNTTMSGRMQGIGISVGTLNDGRVEIISVVQGAPAEEAGVMVGDIIMAINGVSAVGMSIDTVISSIRDPEHERVNLVVERNGHSFTFNIGRAEIRTSTVYVSRLEYFQEATNVVGINADLSRFRYMRLSMVGRQSGDDVRQALDQMRAEGVESLILDLRSNGGGDLNATLDIGNQIIPRGVILQSVNQSGRRRTYSSTLQEQPFENIVVLVDRYTASAAEVIASALQDSGAGIVIGETTFGKGTVQMFYAMRTGGYLRLTVEEYFRRNGETIDGIGVIPDILVEDHRDFSAGGRNEIDPVLTRAIEIMISGLQQ